MSPPDRALAKAIWSARFSGEQGRTEQLEIKVHELARDRAKRLR